jgi:uncharacterized membrane protein YcaP (DUF421 family)
MLYRLLIGEAPWPFLIELVWRAAVMYVLLLVFMRLMGKRVAAQVGSKELAVILMLGAAIGSPIQVPGQGVLPGLVVLAVTMGLQRSLSALNARRKGKQILERTQAVKVLEDGRMLLSELAYCQISHEMLASELRALGVQQLGELRRVYFEANGGFSVIPYKQPRLGLSIMPDGDDEFAKGLRDGAYLACWHCGNVRRADAAEGKCCYCGENRWEPAVQRLSPLQ